MIVLKQGLTRMSNLYEILGVGKDATQDKIRKAYKKLAQEKHPDKNNGQDGEFKALKAAYEVLSDEGRRKIYDETGRVDNSLVNPIEELLSRLFNHVISHKNLNGNIIETCKGLVTENIGQLRQIKLSTDSEVDKFKELVDRVSCDGESNLFERSLNAFIEQSQMKANGVKVDIENHKKLFDELEKYHDEKPAEQQVVFTTGGCGGTN